MAASRSSIIGTGDDSAIWHCYRMFTAWMPMVAGRIGHELPFRCRFVHLNISREGSVRMSTEDRVDGSTRVSEDSVRHPAVTRNHDRPGHRETRAHATDQPFRYPLGRAFVEPDWTRLPGYRTVSTADWESAQWQRAHSVK